MLFNLGKVASEMAQSFFGEHGRSLWPKDGLKIGNIVDILKHGFKQPFALSQQVFHRRLEIITTIFIPETSHANIHTVPDNTLERIREDCVALGVGR